MKKKLLIAGAVLFAGMSVNAQVSIARVKPSVVGRTVSVPLPSSKDQSKGAATFHYSKLLRSSSIASGVKTTPLFQTSYDLQRNGGIANVPGTNKLSFAVTGSHSKDAAFPDRGTFYGYFDGTNYYALPNNRIEKYRTGWPSIAVTRSGKEVIACHIITTNKTVIETRDVAASSGAFTVDSSKGIAGMWPRICTGGPSGNDIHIVTSSDTSKDPAVTSPLKISYYRSVDGGATFQKVALPNDISFIGGSNVSIDARGNTVAIAAGGESYPPLLYKSTDNGLTWTQTVIWKNMPVNYAVPGVLTDNNKTQVGEDTVYNADGRAEVLVDNSGTVHWFSGSMLFKRADINAQEGSVNYYPLNLGYGMLYWNDKLPTDSLYTIASFVDKDNNGKFEDADPTATISVIPNYGVGPVAMPVPTLDTAKGTLSIVYSGMSEYAADTTVKPWVSYRDIYAVTVSNITDLYDIAKLQKGNLFSAPINFTENPTTADAKENIYPSVPKYNSALSALTLPVMWQQDPDLDTHVGQTTPSAANYKTNQLVFNIETVVKPIGIGVNTLGRQSGFTTMATPNPFNSITQVSVSAPVAGSAVLTVFNTMGQKVAEKTANVPAGLSSPFTLSKDELSKGMYIYTLKVGESAATQKLIVE